MKVRGYKFFVIFLILFFMFYSVEIALMEENSELQKKLLSRFRDETPFYLQKYDITLKSGTIIHEYYKKNNFQPVWVTEEGIKESGKDFINILGESEREGLFPEEYNLSVISSLLNRINIRLSEQDDVRSELIKLELLLTDAFFVYTSDMMKGRIDPDEQKRVWVKENTDIDLKNLLSRIEQGNNISPVKRAIENSIPRLPEYEILKEMLAKYRNVKENGGWPTLETDQVLKPGDSGKQVELLRERLCREPGLQIDLSGQPQDEFGGKLLKAVYQFQLRYSLILTGKVDEATKKALNLSPRDIVNKIIINLERMRWLNRASKRTYIIVNIPGFKLKFIENSNIKWEERVIVGTKKRETPILSTAITGLVFNPRWYIPHSIAVKDFLPRVKEDISYLEEKNIRVYEKKGSRFNEVEPDSIDWEELDKDNFYYYLWQDSGPWNALGKVIFQSPNDQHIYIHDTPDKYLFNYNVRAESSGCVRVQNALKMAEYFVKHYTSISKKEMEEILAGNKEVSIYLKERIPLYFVYLTTWVNKNKKFRISKDVYNKDPGIEKIYFNFK